MSAEKINKNTKYKGKWDVEADLWAALEGLLKKQRILKVH